MIENEIVALYKKVKKQMANMFEEFTFANFYRALQSGKRTYTLKNTQITKTIDEEWVDAIKKAVPALDSIVNNPRKYMKRETDVVPIEKARVVDSESVKHLASHTNLINSVEDGFVRPNKILTSYNEESLELYENRFIMTLIIKVSQFIDRRYFLLGTGGNEFSSVVDVDGEFEQAGETTSYKTHMTVHQGADYFDGGVSSKVYEDLFMIRKYITSFRYSPFMRVMGTANQVRAPIINTNLLSKEPNYRACVELWDFIENYNRVGYKIEIVDSAPMSGRDLTDDLDVVNLLQYVQIKKKMGEYDKRRRGMIKCEKKIIKPILEDFEPTDELTIEPSLNMGLKASINGKHKKDMDTAIKDVLLRALRKERVKREMELKEKRARDRETERILKNALKRKSDSEKLELEFKEGVMQSVRDALKLERERALENQRAMAKQAQPAMRILKNQLDRLERDEMMRREEDGRIKRENDSLMNVILKDLLRIEEEREYIRTSPLVIKGGEHMPVPVIENRLPVEAEVVNQYEDMFTPPLTVDEDDWQELRDLKDKKLRRKKRADDDTLKKAISRALSIERKKVADLEKLQAELEAAEREKIENERNRQEQEERDRIAADIAQRERLDKEKQQREQADKMALEADTAQNEKVQLEAAAAITSPTQDKTGKHHSHGGRHGDADDKISKTTPVPIEEEKLGFWRRLIRVLFFWWKK